MALLNMNDLISQYAIQSGILNSQGQFAPEPQQQNTGVLNSPALSQALISLGSTLTKANQAGYGLSGGLSMGLSAFGNTLQQEKDRQREAEKQATQDRMAALKDLISLKTQQEELGLRMQAASLQRRAQQDALDQRNAEKKDAEQRRAEIMNSGDPNLIKAYNMFGDAAAQSYYMDTLKPQERKTVQVDGVPYYVDNGQPVIPMTNGNAPIKPDAIVSGLGVVDGARPTADDAKVMKSAKQAYTQLQTLLPEYQNLVSEYGSEIKGSGGANKIEQKQAQIALQVKNLEDLGALQEQDRQIINDMMVSPVKEGILSAINPLRGLPFVGDKAKATAGAEDFAKYLDDRYQTALKTRGYTDPNFRPIAQRPNAKARWQIEEVQ